MRHGDGHRVLRLDDLPTTPWRNGGGVTRPLLLTPSAAGERWRLSIADIDRDGPFSTFAGWTRHFGVIGQAPVTLRVAGTSHLVRPAETLTFDGADDVWATLPAGPTRALNLMVQTGRGAGGLVTDRLDGFGSYEGVLALAPVGGTVEHGDCLVVPGDVLLPDGRIDVRGHDATVLIVRVVTDQRDG